jgi:outer membrane protein OmpA-like peptidoglycan-associated protein
MPPNDPEVVLAAGPEGQVSAHPPLPAASTAFVAPTLADQVNTIGLDIDPVACLSLNDILFEFDSSFVTADAQKIFRHLPALRARNASLTGQPPLLSVFGHADPVGDPAYNKTLSGRRARAVYGVLTGDAAIWQGLLKAPFGGDDWSAKPLARRMSAALGESPGRSAAALIPDYLALLNPDPVPKSDFLGRGADPGGKADVQGCGEFNPLIILSTQDAKTLTPAQRNAANTPDRRVVVFLFNPLRPVNPALWPCPRATEGVAGCRKRFFPDSAIRLAAGGQRREHKLPQPGQTDPTVAGDTFACRFYQRIAGPSPCEKLLRSYQLRLFDDVAVPLPFAPFVVASGRRVIPGRADADAVLTVHDLIVPSTCTVRWSRPAAGSGLDSPDPAPEDVFDFELDVFVDLPGDDDSDAVALQRLHNLGYALGESQQEDVAAFQRDYAARLPAATVSAPGTLDAPTKAVLRDVYVRVDPAIKTNDRFVQG